jgi:hypothetical protein
MMSVFVDNPSNRALGTMTAVVTLLVHLVARPFQSQLIGHIQTISLTCLLAISVLGQQEADRG